jgi:acyl dehydratase
MTTRASPAVAWSPPAVGTKASVTRTFSEEDVARYAELTGDHNPLHFDEAYARATRPGRLIVHGGLTTGLFNALVAEQLPGPGSVFLSQAWDYPAAVGIGESVTAEVEVLESRGDKPVTRLRCRAWLADGTEVLRGESVVYTLLPTGGSESPSASDR